jgi:hypothetical protein
LVMCHDVLFSKGKKKNTVLRRVTNWIIHTTERTATRRCEFNWRSFFFFFFFFFSLCCAVLCIAYSVISGYYMPELWSRWRNNCPFFFVVVVLIYSAADIQRCLQDILSLHFFRYRRKIALGMQQSLSTHVICGRCWSVRLNLSRNQKSRVWAFLHNKYNENGGKFSGQEEENQIQYT